MAESTTVLIGRQPPLCSRGALRTQTLLGAWDLLHRFID
jgi:hypothetical protein